MGLPDDGSIREAVRPFGEPDEQGILEYVRSGTAIWSEMSAGPDVLNPEAPGMPDVGSLATDGTWLWREDLPYYIATYHVMLPGDFLEHVRSLHHTAPKPPESRLIEIPVEDLGIDPGGKAAGETAGRSRRAAPRAIGPGPPWSGACVHLGSAHVSGAPQTMVVCAWAPGVTEAPTPAQTVTGPTSA
jgi:hypothetical protein